MPQFDTTFFVSQIFWLAISFSLLYLFVSRYFFPKMYARLSHRQDVISKWNAEVSRNLQQQEKHLEEAQKMLASAQVAATQSLQETTQSALEAQKQLDENLKKQLDVRIKRSRKDLSENVERARAQLEQQTHEMADEIINHMITGAKNQSSPRTTGISDSSHSSRVH